MKTIINLINLKHILIITFALIAVPTLWYSCQNDMDGKQFTTTEDLMIDDYITQKDPSMSAFLEIVDRADLRGMIHAYGAYTCFIPTNEAVVEYLNGKGKSSVNDLTEEECLNIVRFHVVPDTIRTADFVDGRLYTYNMRRMYLTTKAEEIPPGSGNIVIRVNRQATIIEADIKGGNGYIHKIDKLLTVPEMTVGDQIMNTGMNGYSIFRNILNKTGWVDSLRRTGDNVWYTVFIPSDFALMASGIFGANPEDVLVERLKVARFDIVEACMDRTPEELRDTLLWTYAAYHCVKGLYYFADLSNISALSSLAPNQAITLKLNKDILLVNEFETFGEPGVAVLRTNFTDLTCYNGVLIDLDRYIGPVKRPPMAVYWDVCTQPEFLKDSRYKRGNWEMTREEFENLSEITTTFRENPASNDFGYQYFGGYDPRFALVNFDGLQVNVSRITDIAFKLPLLTEGTYHVWFCWRRADLETARIRGVFLQEGQDDQLLENVIRLEDYIDNRTEPDILLTRDRKRYTAKNWETTLNSTRLGTIIVQTTGRHTLRFDVIDRGRSERTWIDMLHFIPVTDDQLWPRFDKNGTAHYRGTPCEQIWPFDLPCPPEL